MHPVEQCILFIVFFSLVFQSVTNCQENFIATAEGFSCLLILPCSQKQNKLQPFVHVVMNSHIHSTFSGEKESHHF